MTRQTNRKRSTPFVSLRLEGQSVTIRGQETRFALLEAAEVILLKEGLQGLSFRRIGDVAGINPTLVTYHFGNVSGMLSELCDYNLKSIQYDWHVGDGEANDFPDLRSVLEAWLSALLAPAAFTPGGQALAVLDEAAAHGDVELQSLLRTAISKFNQTLERSLAPHVPWFDHQELALRMRLLSAAALGPSPRLWDFGDEVNQAVGGDVSLLLPFAEAALAAPAPERDPRLGSDQLPSS